MNRKKMNQRHGSSLVYARDDTYHGTAKRRVTLSVGEVHTSHSFKILLLGLLVLSACANDPGQLGSQSLNLPKCSAEGSIFEDIPYAQWKERYHTLTSDAINAHLGGMASTSTMPLLCIEETFEQLVPPSPELKKIATGAVLPAYADAARQRALSETDIGSVLLEFLRVYECSLAERASFLTLSVHNELQTNRGDANKQVSKEQKEIEQEQFVARETLNRSLTIMGGYDRLRPFTLDIECLKRTSLDLRNVLGLTADVASCMPRIWDTKGSLRTLKGDNE